MDGVGPASGWSSASNADLDAASPPLHTLAECAPCPSCPACPVCPELPAAAAAAAPGLSATESGFTCADFDMGECRRQSLEQTTPHIIECSEAGEGGSQEVRMGLGGAVTGGGGGGLKRWLVYVVVATSVQTL